MTEATPARKRGRPTEAERAQRRDEILDAAVKLFVANGFDGVTFDDIREEARVTKRTIYNDFATRSEIFLAAVERLRERALAHPGDGSLPELAARIVMILHSDEAIDLHRLVIASARDFPELGERFYRDGPQSYIAALRQHAPDHAEALFTLLLGEPHRRRLLGLTSAPSAAEAAELATAALPLLRLG